jgi:hypothetical protein
LPRLALARYGVRMAHSTPTTTVTLTAAELAELVWSACYSNIWLASLNVTEASSALGRTLDQFLPEWNPAVAAIRPDVREKLLARLGTGAHPGNDRWTDG